MDTFLLTILIVGFGLLIFSFVIYTLYKRGALSAYGFVPKKRQEDILWLKQYGKALTANISDVKEIRTLEVNGINPFVVVCNYRDGKQSMDWTFNSDYIWSNPLYKIGQQKTVRVLVDPDDHKRFYVDLQSLGLY